MYSVKASAIVFLLSSALCSLVYIYVRYRRIQPFKLNTDNAQQESLGVEYYSALPKRFAANYYPQKQTHNSLLSEPEFTTELQTKPANIFTAFLVKSESGAFQRRKVIRGTWGAVKTFKSINFRVIFIVGVDSEHEKRLEEEALKFKDIIQVNISEEFRHQPRKLLSAFHWIIKSPNFNPQYFIVTEDNCVVNVAASLNYLLEHQKEINDSIHCGYMFEKNAGVIRGNGPRSISRQLYSEETYPPFCRGQLVLLSSAYVENIYRVSTVTNITGFHLDDVLIFGILREKLGIENSIVNIINGGKPLVFYPWDETEKAVYKMMAKWKQWEVYLNATSPPK